VLVELGILIILLALSAFFSGSETALFSLNMVDVKKLVNQGKKNAELLNKMKSKPQKLLITILVGNNLVNIAAASVATYIAIKAFGSTGIGIATGVMTLFVLIFGEITPKSISYNKAEKISLAIAKPIYLFYILFSPIVWMIEKVTNTILKVFGAHIYERRVTEEEIKTIIEMGTEAGVIEKDEREMIHNIFEFGDTDAEKIMTPRSEMVSLDAKTKLIKALEVMIKTGFSRIPVYEGNENNIIGIIYIKDLLKHIKRKRFDKRIKDMVKPVLFVPETKNLDELLNELREKGMHMAIVVDDRGEVKGLITLEDLLEEIVGEIYDEGEKQKRNIRKVDEKTIIAEPYATLKEINKALGLRLKDEKFSTIAGFIINRLGRIPRKGEKLKVKKVEIKIEDASERKIKKIKIKKCADLA